MDHPTATLTKAAERYLLDELAEPQRDEFEAHFFECADCAAQVSDGAAFLAAARGHLGGEVERATQSRRREAPGWRAGAGARVAAALVFASLAGTAAYQRLVTIPGLQREAATREVEAAAAGRRLAPTFLKVSRGEETAVRVARGERFALVRLSDSLPQAYPSYRVTLLDSSGRARWSNVVRPAPTGEELEVVIPAAELASGSHVLELEGIPETGSASSAPPARARYAFTLARGD